MLLADVAGVRGCRHLDGPRLTRSPEQRASGMDFRDRWLHTTEVAEELGVSPETVRRFVRMRVLRATVLLVGGRRTFRIDRADLERFKAAHVRDSVTDDWE